MSLRELGNSIESGVQHLVSRYEHFAWDVQHADLLDWPIWYFAVFILLIIPAVGGLIVLLAVSSFYLVLDIFRSVKSDISSFRARFDPNAPPKDPHERYLWANRLGPYSDERDV